MNIVKTLKSIFSDTRINEAAVTHAPLPPREKYEPDPTIPKEIPADISKDEQIELLRRKVQALDEERKRAWERCSEYNSRLLDLCRIEDQRRAAISRVLGQLQAELFASQL